MDLHVILLILYVYFYYDQESISALLLETTKTVKNYILSSVFQNSKYIISYS